MVTGVSGDMYGNDPSLHAGADGLTQCGSGIDADPSTRAGSSSPHSLPYEHLHLT